VSPSLVVRYFPAEDLMTYASVSRGFKSGGFDQRRVVEGENGEFDPEVATNYELGWKGSWVDRRLQLNGTFYYVDYDDFQSQTFDGSSIKVTNAGAMESYGMELELLFVATEDLTLGSAMGYNKAEYKDFDNGQCTVEYAARTYYDNGGTAYPGAASPPCTRDMQGEPVDNTPEWTVSSYLQYEKGVTDTLLTTTRLEHIYTDSYFLDQDLDRNLTNDATNLVNLRFTLSDFERVWEVALWGRNLLDEEYWGIGLDVPLLSGFAGIAAERRTYGLTLRYHVD
jgi:iron complex outermembrane receptor protein